MAKRSRVKARTTTGSDGTPEGISPRQPCPCGSGRRYKACHGAAGGPPPVFHSRPFEGMSSERDIVALREILPSATAPARLKDSDRSVLLCSLLPLAAPALVRPDGTIWLGLQVQHSYGDPSRDLAASLERALETDPGEMVAPPGDPGDGPRLQDLLVDERVEVTVHEGFDFWTEGADDDSGDLAASLAEMNSLADPTAAVTSVDSGYWTSTGSKEHLRWVRGEDEEPLLTALARLHASGSDVIVPGARLVGMFRAHGLLVPVWDLPLGTGAEALEAPAKAFDTALSEALADTSELTTAERSARSGLANRQVTIR